MFRFEKLDVWQKAIDFAGCVYAATDKFPVDERFGLTSQMRRAAVSVSSNIAEGSGRSSDKDFSRYLEISYGSLMETLSQCHLSHRQGLLDQVTFEDLQKQTEELARMLSGLRKSLQRKANQHDKIV